MKKTFKEKEKTRLIKKFHALLGKAGIDNSGKYELLYTMYGVNSTTQLSIDELVDICDILDKQIHKEIADLDVWRKRVIASIAGYLQLVERDCNIKIIKAIAMRATGYDDFNNIPLNRLINLYNAFLNKQIDIKKLNKDLFIDDLISHHNTNILN